VFRERWYREALGGGRLEGILVAEGESDLWIGFTRGSGAERVEAAVRRILLEQRAALDSWIRDHPAFRTSLEPLPDDPAAPPIARSMLRAGISAGVGPMAAVAGAIAESVGKAVLGLPGGPEEVIVEHGGALWISARERVLVGIYAGLSSLSERLCVEVTPERCPIGICASSAKVGPSLSFGNADAFLVACADGALADALATACGNAVRTSVDLERVVEETGSRPGVLMALGIKADRMAASGSLRILPAEKMR